MLLKDKVILVTGAGHGIGRAHALELARLGARVVVNDLGGSVDGEGSGRDADVVVQLIEARGGTAMANYGDVSDEADAEAMVRCGIDKWGRFDGLVNNAGIVRDKMIWNMSADDFDRVLRVHLRGSWLTCRSAARYWRELHRSGDTVSGRIVNTTSGAGLLGNVGQSNYAPAKAAVMSLTQTLSIELARIGVTVNALSPGAMTRLSATVPGLGAAHEADDYGEGEWDPLSPAMASPLVAWLMSDRAGLVTGQCLRVMGEKLSWLHGWHEHRAIANGGKPWNAEKLDATLRTDLFQVAARGLRIGE